MPSHHRPVPAAVIVTLIVAAAGCAAASPGEQRAGSHSHAGVEFADAPPAVPSFDVPSAVCYPGGFTLTHGVVGTVEVVGGALRWEHDSDAWITTTLPCLVKYESDEPVLPGPTIGVLCWSEGDVVYTETATNIAVDDGALRWVESSTGLRVASTLGCSFMY